MLFSFKSILLVLCNSVLHLLAVSCPAISKIYTGLVGEEICYWISSTVSAGYQLSMQNLCTSQGGLPAEIPDVGANEYVQLQFQSYGTFYIGVRRSSGSTFLYWNDMPLTYYNWNSGQGPNGYGDCVTFNNYLWSCGSCSNGFKVLCSIRQTVIVHGQWGEWSPWSGCSVSCGQGISTRTRQCDNPTPSGGGDYCFGEGISSDDCFVGIDPTERYHDRTFTRKLDGQNSIASLISNAYVKSHIECASDCVKIGPICASYDYDIGTGMCELNSDTTEYGIASQSVSYWESTEEC